METASRNPAESRHNSTAYQRMSDHGDFPAATMQHEAEFTHITNEMTRNHSNTLSRGRPRIASPDQRLLDFERPTDTQPTAVLPVVESATTQFARRFAA